MRAVAKTKPGVGIEIINAPRPKIKPTEVLLEIKACGVCGSDMPLYEWLPEGRLRRGKPIELPRIIGHEPSGVVVEVGSEVPASRGLKPGDRVASDSWGGCGQCYYCRIGFFNMCSGDRKNIGSLSDGAMAEFCAVPFFNLYKIADSVTFEEAALAEPLGVAMNAMEKLVYFRPGDDAVVMGCGPIGLLEAMLVRAAGANKVIVSGLGVDEKRLAIAKKLGFHTVVSDKENLKDIVMKETGLGADVVFDATSSGAPAQGITLLKAARGQLVLTAVMEGQVPLNGRDLTTHEVIITNHLGRNPSCWYRALSVIAAKKVDVSVIMTHKFKIEQADEAFKVLQRREGMKVLIVP